jgi:type I restriction enzyme M protein
VAASGWGAELIPEEQILQSQFPEVLAQIENDQTRIAELEGLFAAANEIEDEDAELEEIDTGNGVLPKALVKALKDERKTLAGEVKGIKKLVKERRLDARRTERAGSLFGNSNEILTEASDTEEEELVKWQRIQEIDEQLARRSALEGELKKLKASIREVEKQKDTLIASARAKISEDEAKKLILERFQRLLTEQFDGYLRQYQRAFIAAMENLWQKYAITTKQILAERNQAAAQLDQFMKELGYE